MRDVILELAWCDYPSCPPPRFIAQFASALSTLTDLCMRLNYWDFSPPPPRSDLAEEYYNAFNCNRTDDARRAARRWIKFDASDTKMARGADGNVLDFPSRTGVCVPPVPIELVSRRPRLFLHYRALHEVGPSNTIPSVPTPNSKRNRAAEAPSDIEMDCTVHRGGWKACACGSEGDETGSIECGYSE